MKTIEEYVERIFKNIPDNEKNRNIKQEIIQNLEEKVRDLMGDGKLEEDAINKTIVEFGDVEEFQHEFMDELSYQEKPALKKKKTNYSNRFLYSLFGSTLIIALVVFINVYYTPGTIWFVYPTFAVLWWPLSSFFVLLNHKDKEKNK